jgi:ABC-type Na+ transport system ATPase subunit NatA
VPRGIGRIAPGINEGDLRTDVFDDPATGLDPIARIELRAQLKQLQGEGITILISSHILTSEHSPSAIRACAHHCRVMRRAAAILSNSSRSA